MTTRDRRIGRWLWALGLLVGLGLLTVGAPPAFAVTLGPGTHVVGGLTVVVDEGESVEATVDPDTGAVSLSGAVGTIAVISPDGTQFALGPGDAVTASYSSSTNQTNVDVTAGSVDVTSPTGGTTTLAAGTSFSSPGSPTGLTGFAPPPGEPGTGPGTGGTGPGGAGTTVDAPPGTPGSVASPF